MRSTLGLLVGLLLCGCSPPSPPPDDNGRAASSPASPSLTNGAHDRTIQIELEPQFPSEQPVLQHTVEISNSTGRPVHFIQVVKSCSCAEATLEKDTLSPGEKTAIRFRVNWAGRSGPQSLGCRLVEDNGSTWTVTVNTVLYERGRFGDEVAASFGMVNPGESLNKSTTFLTYARRPEELLDPIKFDAAQSLRLDVGRPNTERLANGVWQRAYPVTINLSAPREAGPAQALIQAIASGPGAPKVFAAAVNWSVRSVYQVTPPSVYVGVPRAGSPAVSRSLKVRRTDGGAFRIESARLDRESAKVSVTGDRGGTEWVVTLDIDVGSAAKSICDRLVLVTDQRDQGQLVVPVAIVPVDSASGR
jgi:Protein of unknown function (DUF1573)